MDEPRVRVRIETRTPAFPYRHGQAAGLALVFGSSRTSGIIGGAANGALCFWLLDVAEAEYVRLVFQLRAPILVAFCPDQLAWQVIGWATSAMYESNGRSIEAVVALSVAIQAAILGMTYVQFVFLSALWGWCILDRTLLVTLYSTVKAFVTKAIAQRRRLRHLRAMSAYDSESE
jgi:hypothetical protein